MASLIEARRRLMMQPRKISVVWNNFQPPFSTALYRPYDATYTSLTDISDGIVRQTWLNSGGFYLRTTRFKTDYPHVQTDHKYYISYCINPAFSGSVFGIEFAGGAVVSASESATENMWSRIHALAQGRRNGLGIAYFANKRSGRDPAVGESCLLKAPIYVDLTVMYGSGNEPTLEEFERQCALNGIDLTQSYPQDSGTMQSWYI